MAESPTVRRRRLGVELRRLRESVGMTIDEAASAADISKSALSRIENSLVMARVPVVRALVQTYRVEDPYAQALIELARDAGKRGWWQSYSDVLRGHAANFVGFEAEATSIRTYESTILPGILQTPEYAEALFRGFRFLPVSEEEIQRRITVRMKRQERLADMNLWVIVDESVLRRPTGGQKAMRAQLDRVIEVTRRPSITLQVIPNELGSHPGQSGPFTILEFTDDPPLVYVETAAGEVWVDKPEDVRTMSRTFDHIVAAALDPEASLDRVRHIMMEML